MPPAEILKAEATCEVDMIRRQGTATCVVSESQVGEHDGTDDASRGSSFWYALWTRSHCERLVRDQLTTKGFHAFLPTVDVWSRRAGVRHRIQVPMFPGYLFLRHTMDKPSYIEVRKMKGLVCVLGEQWDRLAVIPDREIEAIQTVLGARVPVFPHAHLCVGQRARITRGPLADVEGILLRQMPHKGLLVLSVELLKRSVAIEVDCTCVASA